MDRPKTESVRLLYAGADCEGSAGIGRRLVPLSPREAVRLAVRTHVRDMCDLPDAEAEAMADAEAKALRWELLGDVALLSQRSFVGERWTALANAPLWAAVGRALGAARLARQAEIDASEKRHSRAAILWAAEGAAEGGWTEVRDNGVIYGLDVTKVMYSSGNGTEKARMGALHAYGETVVDLFSGIGYFTVPLLKKAGAARAIACEWNAPAAAALRHNLARNGVAQRCEVREGDNREVAPKGIAHRVLLGLIPTSEKSWGVAIAALRPEGGMLHVHANVKQAKTWEWAQRCAARLTELSAARSTGPPLCCVVQHVERVKSYAPRVDHVVVDVACYPQRDLLLAPSRAPNPTTIMSAAEGTSAPSARGAVLQIKCAGRDEAALAADLRHGSVPAVLKDLNVLPLGSNFWAPGALIADSALASRTVTVHECDTSRLDFVLRNFEYRPCAFGDLVRRAAALSESKDGARKEHGPCIYLRSVGRDSRSQRADLARDFPSLARGVRLPALCAAGRVHSSPLRVSSAGCRLWPHFDVMDNVLLQLQGTKRVVLYPPQAAEALQVSPGSSSSPLLRDAELDAVWPPGACVECVLQPGEALYIPALWLHAVTAIDFSVSANVFWAGLDGAAGGDAKKDLYGNRDPPAAEEAARAARAAGAALRSALPSAAFRNFYAARAAQALRREAAAGD